MGRGGFDGILEADGFKARMRALADRTGKLARGIRYRRERRVGGTARRAALAPASPHLRPVVVKVLYHDRGRRALPNTVKALANYLAKQGPLFDRTSADVDKDALAARWAEDRRVFHVIVSPNDGHRIDDMAGFARDLVAAWERRTGPLEWAASVETKPDIRDLAWARRKNDLRYGATIWMRERDDLDEKVWGRGSEMMDFD